ncbi:MAG: M28 family peptidase [Colwellia sp.]
MTKTKFFLLLLLFIGSFCHHVFADPNNIKFEQVVDDVKFLAHDNLQGRANFSPELEQAADYIAKRFKENGLIPANHFKNSTLTTEKNNFLQKFSLKKITPEKLSVIINHQKIDPKNLAMVSTEHKFSWRNTNTKSVTFHHLSKNDQVESRLQQINQQGGQHLILLHPSHKNIFEHYQHTFQQGLLKQPSLNGNAKGGTIVVVLTTISINDITQLTITGSSHIVEKILTNVVGVLPGSSQQEEIVLYSAHYDHLGVNENANTDKGSDGDKIFNGANDDASGTSAVINLAHYFSQKATNTRTLMFVAFSGEEIGKFGSTYFSQQLNAENITAMINIEMIGQPSKFGSGTVWMTGMERSNLGELLNKSLLVANNNHQNKNNENNEKKIYADPYPEQGLFYRSDNAALARLGVPAHSFSSAQLDTDRHYHTTSDDINSLNLESMYRVIQALASATEPLTTGKMTPSRIANSYTKINFY